MINEHSKVVQKATPEWRQLLARLERLVMRTGELMERCQGKGWPDKESDEYVKLRDEVLPELRASLVVTPATPIDMLLYCPNCGVQHIDKPEPCEAKTCESGCALPGPGDCLAWTNPPHRSHLCLSCNCIWRPADVPTNGVATVASKGKADTWVGKAAFAAPALPKAQCTEDDQWNCKYCSKTKSCEALKDPRNFGPPESTLRRALGQIKIRLHFMDWPAESFWNAGTEEKPRWIADWRYEIGLIEHALHGTPLTAIKNPTDTRPAHSLSKPTKLPIPPAPVEPLSVVYVEGWNAAVDEFFGGAPAPEPLVITVATTEEAIRDAVALLRTPGHDVAQVISLLTTQPDGVWQSHGASDTMRHPESSDLVGGETDCSLPVHHLQHDLYSDADADRPDVICDSNGQVVLDLCKRCGKAEAELTENLCITHVNQGSKS